MHPNRRTALALCSALAISPALRAQTTGWPSRPVKLVWPFTAGGTGDPVARGLAEGLGKTWGVPVVVDNRPGAGGMIGTTSVAKAEPDGHTLLLHLTGVIQTPLLFNTPPYNPLTDLVAVTRVASLQSTLAVSRQLGVSSYAELLAFAKNKGKLAYGTVGLGSGSHLQMEALGKELGQSLEHVAYKGEAQLVTDLVGGQIGVGHVSALTASKYKDRITALVVTGDQRSPLLPNVPSLDELGSRAMRTKGWFGLFAPARTPSERVARISQDAGEVLREPKLRQTLADMGILVSPCSPAEFASQVQRDQRYWADLVTAVGIQKQ